MCAKSMTVGVSTGLTLCCLPSGQDKASLKMKLCDCSGENYHWLVIKSLAQKNRAWKMFKYTLIHLAHIHLFLSRFMFFFLEPWIHNICECVWEQILTVPYHLCGRISFLSVSVCNCSLWRTIEKRKIQWTCFFYALKLCGLHILRSLFW